MKARSQPLALECVHLETINGHIGFPGRTLISEVRECVHLSGVLNRIRKQRRMTFAQVDRVAVTACGRRWCDFTGVSDYEKSLRAVAQRSA